MRNGRRKVKSHNRRSGFSCSAPIERGGNNATGETCTLTAWNKTNKLRMLQSRRIARNANGGAGTSFATDEQSFFSGKTGQLMLKKA